MRFRLAITMVIVGAAVTVLATCSSAPIVMPPPGDVAPAPNTSNASDEDAGVEYPACGPPYRPQPPDICEAHAECVYWSALPKITRSQALANGKKYVDYKFVPKELNLTGNGSDTVTGNGDDQGSCLGLLSDNACSGCDPTTCWLDNGVPSDCLVKTSPLFIADKRTGFPYARAGYDTISTLEQCQDHPISVKNGCAAKKMLAGGTKYRAGRNAGVLGLDCNGFIGKAFGLKENEYLNPSNVNSNCDYTKTELADAVPGDLMVRTEADGGEHGDHVMMITQIDLAKKLIYVYEAGSPACCEVNNNLRGDIVKAAVYYFEQLRTQKQFKLCKPKNLREGLEHTGNTCDSGGDPGRFSVTDWADVKGQMTWVAKKGMWAATQCYGVFKSTSIVPGTFMTVCAETEGLPSLNWNAELPRRSVRFGPSTGGTGTCEYTAPNGYSCFRGRIPGNYQADSSVISIGHFYGTEGRKVNPPPPPFVDEFDRTYSWKTCIAEINSVQLDTECASTAASPPPCCGTPGNPPCP